MTTAHSTRWWCVGLTAAFLGAFAPDLRVAAQTRVADPNPNYDGRIGYNATYRPVGVQNAALPFAQQASSELRVTFDERTGVVRTLYNNGGYLTAPDTLHSVVDIALDYARANLAALGLEPGDLADYETTDVVLDRATGSTHLYLRQRLKGLPLYNGQLQVNVNREGRILSVNNAFHPGLANAINTSEPALGAAAAVSSLARHLGITDAAMPTTTAAASGDQMITVLEATGISVEPVKARLMWLAIRREEVRLVWNVQVATPDGQHLYDANVDAASGEVWTRFEWTASDRYTVYPRPVESPNHTTPLPPEDGRVGVAHPADPTASPYGWHDTNGAAGAEYTIMRGNNVHAYDDSASTNAPPASEPDCGSSLDCSFRVDLTAAPAQYTPAATANLFYWNNIIHDVQYQYGFTESAGNFQLNNYGRGGLGNDEVRAEAQDGGGTNNANFSTPPDGSRPRMQMYLWTSTTPARDGDLDNSIIVHEYGHGISNRLVGGPSNVSCLSNSQQPGEGLSDWWALAYTAAAGDTGPMGRGIGTYALGQATTGPGIRTQRYSTDSTINTWTYSSINGMAVPHGVGSVWTEAAWRMYWALVDQHGFSTDLYSANGRAGNQRAMLYVNAGLMNTACSPTFTDVRDGILQAATDNHGGEDVCRIWGAFAGMGLGVTALSGGSNSVAPVDGFAIPISCGGTAVAPFVATQPADQDVHAGFTAQFTSTSAGNPAPTYRWQISTSGGASWSDLGNTAPYSGATTTTLTVTGVTAGLHEARYRLVASNLAGSVASDGARLILAGSRYDASLATLACAAIASSCQSGSLLIGRDSISGGAEPNQPNTIRSSCADQQVGRFAFDESIDKVSISTVNGSLLQPGKTVRIDVTAYVYATTGDRLNLFHTTDTTSPSWTHLATLTPPGPGRQVMSYTFTLPVGSGSMQAIRAKFGWVTDTAPCEAGGPGKSFTDFDDLVFSTVATFTDDPIVAGATLVGKVHIDELRTRVNAARASWSLAAYFWTDPAITAQSAAVKVAHVQELRDALNAAYDAAGRTRPVYTDQTLAATGTVIKAVHIIELRDAVKALE